jgi:hypothetical protein
MTVLSGSWTRHHPGRTTNQRFNLSRLSAKAKWREEVTNSRHEAGLDAKADVNVTSGQLSGPT